MRKIILSVAFMTCSLVTLAQNLEILYTRIDVIPGDKREARVALKNNSSSAINVKVERTHNSLASGHVSNFCWDICYGPATNTSNGYMTIQPGAVDSINFLGDLDPNGNNGISTVRYRFYNQSQPSDSVGHTFVYNVGMVTSVKEASVKPVISAYPNPADNEVSFIYNSASAKNAQVVIYNALGALVSRVQVEPAQNVVVLPLNNLHSGIYYYSLIIDGKQQAAKKLTVYHK